DRLVLWNNRFADFFGFEQGQLQQGLDLLIKAMADPRLKKMNIKLIVAGEYYGNQAFYESLIESEGVGAQIVQRTDFIPNDEVKNYFCAADLVVQPYKSATQSGISQLAYHFEKPMVVTKVGGLPEIVDHGRAGYVVEVEPQAIADAIVDFYQQNKEATFVKSVIENKKRFSWASMAKGVKRLSGAQTPREKSTLK
ncbi:MAG: glycosyltransferase, partial [Bacteroidota bacterium]